MYTEKHVHGTLIITILEVRRKETKTTQTNRTHMIQTRQRHIAHRQDTYMYFIFYANRSGYDLLLCLLQSFSYSTSDLHTNHTLCVSANPSTNNPCMDTAYNFSLSSQHIHELIIAMGSDGKLNVTKVRMVLGIVICTYQ